MLTNRWSAWRISGFVPESVLTGIDQVGGVIVVSALVATVAVLARRAALRAGPLDEAVGQKRAGLGVVELRDFLLFDQSGLAQGGPNLDAYFPRFRAVGAAVVVELDVEAGEIGDVGLPHPGDQFLLADALLPGADHDGRAVGVVGADIDAPPPAELLEADPDVRLQVLDQVSDMDVAVGVGQGAGDEEAFAGHAISLGPLWAHWQEAIVAEEWKRWEGGFRQTLQPAGVPHGEVISVLVPDLNRG